MAIILEHIPFYREIFSLPEFFKEPFLMIGLPSIEGSHIPEDFSYKTLKELLINKGLKKVESLDLFDPKADIKHDLNKPISKKYHNKYKVIIDIGTIEHIFDTRQCLENYFRMISNNGIFVLVTPVNGYFGHGLHVFNPEGLINSLKENNFKIVYKKYTSSTGIEVEDPSIKKDVLIWIVAKKTKSTNKFIVPQQEIWKSMYTSLNKKQSNRQDNSAVSEIKFYLKNGKRNLIRKLPKGIINSIYGRYF